MKVSTLTVELIPDVLALMELGEPYIRPRTPSDYWLYARLFHSSCPVALIDNTVAGAVIAFRSQEDPSQVYLQDVMTHPDFRRRGVTRALIEAVRFRAAEWQCERLYLTSEPENSAAHATWTELGFRNVEGDYTVHGVSVVTDFKGPGKDRAVYDLVL
ncbi:GNAT family N-acetyltransferase [Nocardia sp. NBC_00416]|uniref:GNAT family N-acetyltransferase n=1 Tax=Nocardia sp. NBC_00416 TaxID=2975991 RepID=UPI002E200A4B